MSSDSSIDHRHWQPVTSASSSSSSSSSSLEESSKSYALSGKIMLTSIIILFVVVVFLVLLHLYTRWYLLRIHRRNHSTRRRNRRNRSSRIIFTVDYNQSSPTAGLAPSVLNTLPLFIYSENSDDENAPECAVCLAEFEQGEKGRLLPKCKHSFHTECIDMWFFSHSTCPLCRSPVEPVEPETTSLADRRKGIDIPSRTELVIETESPSQGNKSPGGSRLLSFKRIISMSIRSPSSGVGPSSLPVSTELDLESAIQESEVESTQSETVSQ